MTKRGDVTATISDSEGRTADLDSPEGEGIVEGVVRRAMGGSQASLALCATCAHERVGEHPKDGPCQATWEEATPDETRRTIRCRCNEYWPIRNQREDGMSVIEHELSFGGGTVLMLNRRLTTELWESLASNQELTLEVDLVVVGKGFKPKVDKGFVIGLTEMRKLRVTDVHLGEVDRETGEIT